jgi:hypothetical protein
MKIKFGYHERTPKALIGKTGKLNIFGGRDAKPCVITLHVPAYPVGYFLVESAELYHALSKAEGEDAVILRGGVDAQDYCGGLGRFIPVNVHNVSQKPTRDAQEAHRNGFQSKEGIEHLFDIALFQPYNLIAYNQHYRH